MSEASPNREGDAVREASPNREGDAVREASPNREGDAMRETSLERANKKARTHQEVLQALNESYEHVDLAELALQEIGNSALGAMSEAVKACNLASKAQVLLEISRQNLGDVVADVASEASTHADELYKQADLAGRAATNGLAAVMKASFSLSKARALLGAVNPQSES
jgi:DNA-binding ferritin-like protein